MSSDPFHDLRLAVIWADFGKRTYALIDRFRNPRDTKERTLERVLELASLSACPACGGNGAIKGTTEKCDRCEGTGAKKR